MKDALLIWLGGIIARATRTLLNPESLEHYRSLSRRELLIALAFMAIWPVQFLLLPILIWLRDVGLMRMGVTKESVTCVSCTRKTYYFAVGRWSIMPASWLMNDAAEVACSIQCAKKHEASAFLHERHVH